MSYAAKGVMVLGIVVILIGGMIVVGYQDAQNRAERASQEGMLGGIEALGIYIRWMTNAFRLLILNLFVTGVALVTSGYGLLKAMEE